jgi:class 3 adenylate cyclase/pimeloyl-ACP methyl ester carboxylesterase
MEPRIQYARTSDGVNIAFFTMGAGPPLVHMPQPFPHLQLEWEVPEVRAWCERLAANHQLVMYDSRGFGLSDRDVDVRGLEWACVDIDAIADKLGLEKFALLGMLTTAPGGVVYATTRPERVSSLILVSSIVRWEDIQVESQLRSARALIDVDWDLYSRTVASTLLGWEGGTTVERLAALIRESIEPSSLKRNMTIAESWDISELLPKVVAPTLVVHRRGAPYPKIEVQRELAARIPNARLSLQEGSSFLPFIGDMDSMVNTIEEFLGVSASESRASSVTKQGDVQTILFTDLVGHTEMMSRLGDERGREVLREHERITREVLAAHGGTEVKTMGDGFMASFGSVTKAVECAIALQKAFADWNASERAQHAAPLQVRVGLNAGEPIEEEGDLFGATVILASRIAAKAEGGEILVADTVRGLCSGKGFLFADRGEFVAKGFEEPVRVYDVIWRERE